MEITNEMREKAINTLRVMSAIARSEMTEGMHKEELIFALEMGINALLKDLKESYEKEIKVLEDIVLILKREQEDE